MAAKKGNNKHRKERLTKKATVPKAKRKKLRKIAKESRRRNVS